MTNEMKVFTQSYEVIDSKGRSLNYNDIVSAKIEDGRLILRGEHGNITASFSKWESSTVAPSPPSMVIMTAEEMRLRTKRGATSEDL